MADNTFYLQLKVWADDTNEVNTFIVMLTDSDIQYLLDKRKILKNNFASDPSFDSILFLLSPSRLDLYKTRLTKIFDFDTFSFSIDGSTLTRISEKVYNIATYIDEALGLTTSSVTKAREAMEMSTYIHIDLFGAYVRAVVGKNHVVTYHVMWDALERLLKQKITVVDAQRCKEGYEKYYEEYTRKFRGTEHSHDHS